MISKREQKTGKRFQHPFAEFASLFGKGIFVMIIVYADESGTHDVLGIQDGSKYPIIAGFAARKSVWDKFCIAWDAMLKKYDAPYFHGRELRAVREVIIHKKPETKELLKNPYYKGKWNMEKIEAFRISLTKIAGTGNKIPLLGAANIPWFNTIKDKLSDKYPYKYCVKHFFELYDDETRLKWGNFKSSVTFFFDRTDDKKWKNAVESETKIYQKKNTRIIGAFFVDKTKREFLPLQAADLMAYRVRQLAEDHANHPDDQLKLDNSDRILFKNFMKLRSIPSE